MVFIVPDQLTYFSIASVDPTIAVAAVSLHGNFISSVKYKTTRTLIFIGTTLIFPYTALNSEFAAQMAQLGFIFSSLYLSRNVSPYGRGLFPCMSERER